MPRRSSQKAQRSALSNNSLRQKHQRDKHFTIHADFLNKYTCLYMWPSHGPHRRAPSAPLRENFTHTSCMMTKLHHKLRVFELLTQHCIQVMPTSLPDEGTPLSRNMAVKQVWTFTLHASPSELALPSACIPPAHLESSLTKRRHYMEQVMMSASCADMT